MDQLLGEWLRPTPEVHGSNPVIRNFLFGKDLLLTVQKNENKEKMPEWPIF